MLVDSHCHLTDDQFDEDRPQVLLRASEEGLVAILAVASDLKDAEKVAKLVKGGIDDPSHGGAPRLWGTAGIHPHEAESASPGDMDGIRDLLSGHHRMVAVGETGLDFYYDNSPRAVQETLFRDHMTLAEDLGLPVVVHSRSADQRTGEILGEWGDRVRGVLHCFTGGEELLDTALSMGWMVSFTGIITFKKYDGHALVRGVPRDRLMVETDAPYLAPAPHRGRRNEPSYVARVAQGLAAIREEPLEEVQRYTSENARDFFGLAPFPGLPSVPGLSGSLDAASAPGRNP